MERKIGEIFEYNGEWLQCVEQPKKYDKTVCAICDFHGIGNCELDKCSGTYRSDKKSIIFRKLKKVGEMYEKRVSDGTSSTFQRYRVYNSVILPKEPYIYCNFIDSTVEIEIKQNKEEMEEKKIQHYDCFFDGKSSKSNLKPFDLKAAKAGKPVCTRDGRKARIICFDKKGGTPIVGLIQEDGFETVATFNESGLCLINGAYNLMMLPEKKEGWVNIYKERVYKSKEEAVKNKYDGCTYIDTIKVEWEE